MASIRSDADDDDHDDDNDDDNFDFYESNVDINDHDEDIQPDTGSIPSVSINFAKCYGGTEDGQTKQNIKMRTRI